MPEIAKRMFRQLAARLVVALAVVCAAAPAHAADLTVVVRDASGRPVADAVVIADVPGRAAPAEVVVNQRDMMFTPFVTVVAVGSTVVFTNLDPFRHHVYSFSPARRFEIKLFGEGERRSVRFDRTGLVAVGCNIHDQMQAFIQVVDTPFARKADSAGRVTLRGLPGGVHRLRVWHPYLRAPANELIVEAATGTETVPVTLRLRRPAPMQHGY
ncbi:MAG TPA: methylamine utilization protein [Croceibacterium sp.]|nr:methylamine utilization protein [Croceibacterium sp.]